MKISTLNLGIKEHRTVIIVQAKPGQKIADFGIYMAAFSSIKSFYDLWLSDEKETGIVYHSRPGRKPIVLTNYYQVARMFKIGVPCEIFAQRGETITRYQVIKLIMQRNN